MNYKIIFPIIGVSSGIIIAIIFLVNPIQDTDTSIDSKNGENIAIEIVQSYRGIDGKGDNLLDAFRKAFDEVYPRGDILLQTGTRSPWSAIKESPFSNTYQVQFEIKTTQEDSLFIWKVNLDDKKVWSNQEGARGMLNLLDQT